MERYASKYDVLRALITTSHRLPAGVRQPRRQQAQGIHLSYPKAQVGLNRKNCARTRSSLGSLRFVSQHANPDTISVNCVVFIGTASPAGGLRTFHQPVNKFIEPQTRAGSGTPVRLSRPGHGPRFPTYRDSKAQTARTLVLPFHEKKGSRIIRLPFSLLPGM